MKTIIAGSRTITDYRTVKKAIIDSNWEDSISEVVCGGAKGVDALGAAWAKSNGIPVKHFPASWNTHGKAAGPIRNEQMAQYADALILVWDGQSRGSANMLELAEKYGLEVSQYKVNKG